MTHQYTVLLAAGMLVTGCAALQDPGKPLRAPYQGIENFGPPRAATVLPKTDANEVWLGRIKQANGKYVADDGTFEVKVGSRGECVYAFRVSSLTGRLVSWRLASKSDPQRCE